MLKKSSGKGKTVAEKVAESILHPNGNSSDSDSADEATVARVTEYDSDEYELPPVGSTEFRKRNVKLLSEQNVKYKGKIASRKDFEEDESESGDDYENSDSEDEAMTNFTASLRNNYSNAMKDVDSEDCDEELAEDDGNDDTDLESEEEDGEDAEVISKVNKEAEVQKGLCVQNQLHIWERLLELRINLQKIVNKTNQLPSPQDLKELEKNNNEYKDIKTVTMNQTFLLLQNLLTLKYQFSSQCSEVTKAANNSLKRPLQFKDHTSGEPPFKQVCQHLEEEFVEFRTYRNDVLLKWDDRTKLLQPGAGSKKKTLNEEYDIIKKIDNTLVNKSLLIEKSQQLKNTPQNESPKENTLNPNIYDDTDFYHQQLRELIEYKANTTSNMSEVTKQFLELQKLRQKMKKKVDTRASKGRKLRYIVHNKLINFMAPHDNTTWTMESIDELSKSLFV